MSKLCINTDVSGVKPFFSVSVCPGQSYSKKYGIEPRYNEPRYNEFLDITNIIRKPKSKIYLDITNYNFNTRQKIDAEPINKSFLNSKETATFQSTAYYISLIYVGMFGL